MMSQKSKQNAKNICIQSRKADIRNRNQLFVDTKKYLHVEQRRSVTVLEIESFHLNITENKYVIASRCPPVSVLGSRSNFASDRWLIDIRRPSCRIFHLNDHFSHQCQCQVSTSSNRIIVESTCRNFWLPFIETFSRLLGIAYASNSPKTTGFQVY